MTSRSMVHLEGTLLLLCAQPLRSAVSAGSRAFQIVSMMHVLCPGSSLRPCRLGRSRAGTASSLPLPSTFLPHNATSAARPAGGPKFFVPSMPASLAGSQGAWGQPSIPEADPDPTFGGGFDSSQANGGLYESEAPSIPAVAASQAEDHHTSYAALQVQWPQNMPGGHSAHQAQHGYAGDQTQSQAVLDYAELTEVQL